jgi:hypothetical protein
MGCPRSKFFFSDLPNLLLQKIRLPLISFFSRVSYIWGSSTGNGQWSTKSFASKNQTALDFFFLWSQLHLGKLHLGKLHRERAVTRRIFQALPTQTNTTTVAFIYKIIFANINEK